jgi:hypothetical protein
VFLLSYPSPSSPRPLCICVNPHVYTQGAGSYRTFKSAMPAISLTGATCMVLVWWLNKQVLHRPFPSNFPHSSRIF